MPCTSSVLFDDDCRVGRSVYDLWLSQMYKQNIGKILLESELYLLEYCNIDILTFILMQNKLKCTSCLLRPPHVTKAGNLAKKLANCCDLPNSSKFFSL